MMLKFWAEHPILLCFTILFSVGMIGAYPAAALLMAAVVAVCYAGCWWMVWLDRRSHAQILRRWGLVHRADYEHFLVMNGDARGTFGRYPPA